MDKRKTDFASDKDLVKASLEFLAVALAVVAEDQTEAFSRLFEPGSGVQMWGAVFFYVAPEAQARLDTLSSRVIKKLGHRAAVEKDIESTAWTWAAKLAKLGQHQPKREDATELLKELERAKAMALEVVLPNYTYRLAEGIRAIEIGPVRIERTEDVASRLTFSPDAIPVTISIDEGRGSKLVKNSYLVHMPSICWHVAVRAAQKNAREEAAWLVDIAIGLLRLAHSPRWEGLVPGLTHREPPAFEKPYHDKSGFLYREGFAATGGLESPRYYLIDGSVVETANSAEFKTQVSAIFAGRDDTLGERVARALAWITRGRRSEDRPQALLFFSTALEALFTTKGNDSITGTIARHSAVVWTAEPSARITVSKAVSNLYEKRSTVVHQGAPGVLRTDVQKFQHIVETVTWRILQSADLTMSHTDFHKELVEAGYGLPWPKADVDEGDAGDEVGVNEG